MKDWLHKVLTAIDHNRGKVIGLLLACCLIGWLAGCQPETIGLIGTKKVTATELEGQVSDVQSAIAKRVAQHELEAAAIAADITSTNEKYIFAKEDLNRQNELRKQIIGLGGGLISTLATGGAVAWADLIPSGLLALTAFGTAGGIYDGRRKDRVITDLKTNGNTT